MLPLHSLVHAPFSSFASTSTCALPLLIHKAEFPPFFTQPQKPRRDDRETEEAVGKGKRKQSMKDGKEEDVDDREWEMRVGECRVLKVRDENPLAFWLMPRSLIQDVGFYTSEIYYLKS